MSIQRKTGFVLIVLGILMFLTGASLFTYRGDINPIVSKIGMYSIILWLPAIILGIIIVVLKKR